MKLIFVFSSWSMSCDYIKGFWVNHTKHNVVTSWRQTEQKPYKVDRLNLRSQSFVVLSLLSCRCCYKKLLPFDYFVVLCSWIIFLIEKIFPDCWLELCLFQCINGNRVHLCCPYEMIIWNLFYYGHYSEFSKGFIPD